MIRTGLGNVVDNIDVWSYVLGVSTSWNIGAFSLGGQVSYGMNQGAVTGWATGSNPRAVSSPYLKIMAKTLPMFTPSRP